MVEFRIQWPTELIDLVKSMCESSGLVKRAAFSFAPPQGDSSATYLISIEMDHDFLLRKFAESLSSRIKVDSENKFPVAVENWGPEAEAMSHSNPETVFFIRENKNL